MLGVVGPDTTTGAGCADGDLVKNNVRPTAAARTAARIASVRRSKSRLFTVSTLRPPDSRRKGQRRICG